MEKAERWVSKHTVALRKRSPISHCKNWLENSPMNPVAKIRDLQPAWPPSLHALAAEKLRNDVQGVAAGHCADEGREVDVRGIVGTV